MDSKKLNIVKNVIMDLIIIKNYICIFIGIISGTI